MLICQGCGKTFPVIDNIPAFGSEVDIAKWTEYHTDTTNSDRIAGGKYVDSMPIAPDAFYSRFLPEDAQKVLDCGGGDGNTTADWADRHTDAEIHFMDLSIHALKKVQRRQLANMLPVCAPADYRFPYPDNYFDVVSTVFMVEHLSPSSLSRFYDEAFRVLRPGGRLVVASDSAFYDSVVHPLLRLLRHRRFVRNDPTHINLMSPRQCVAGVNAAGFKLVDRTIHWIAGRFSLVRKFYRLLPQAVAEALFSTMYVIIAEKASLPLKKGK